jgi:hypothetical protein
VDLFKFWGTKEKNIQENISLLFSHRNMGDSDNNIRSRLTKPKIIPTCLNATTFIHAIAPDFSWSLRNIDPFDRLPGQLFDFPGFPNFPGKYLS